MQDDDLYDVDDGEFEIEDLNPPQSLQSKIIAKLQTPEGKRLAIIAAAVIGLLLLLSFIIFLIIVWPSSDSSDDERCASYSEQNSKDWSYGVMVDLGSSGSRIGIYQWTSTEPVQAAPTGGPYWYKEQRPGVSSYAENPEGAATSLIPLLDYAANQLYCTNVEYDEIPIFLFATAGLRLLPESTSAEILDSIRLLVKTEYEFKFEDDWARILSGTEEAIYDWLSVQQIELVYDSSKGISDQSETSGVIDMGGGSVEISFAPTEDPKSPYNSTTLQTVHFDDESYTVYGYSFLPYGHNEARKLVQRELIDEAEENQTNVANPCFLIGYNETITQDGVDYNLYGTGNVESCSEYANGLFNHDCSFSSCSFNGVYQPPVMDSIFYALDNFAKVTNFFDLGSNPRLIEIWEATVELCGTTYEQAEINYEDRPLDSIPLSNYCFEGVYAFDILTNGFHFPDDTQQITFADELFGIEVSWAYGAMVDMVDKHDW